MAPQPAPLAVICDDRPEMQRVLASALGRCGLRVVGVVGSLPALLDVIEADAPAVAVLELPMFGSTGLDAIAAVRGLAPHCQIVVLSPFETLEPAVQAAGARALVGEEDLVQLAAVLRDIVDEAVAGRAVSPPVQRGVVSVDPPAVVDVRGKVRTNSPS